MNNICATHCIRQGQLSHANCKPCSWLISLFHTGQDRVGSTRGANRVNHCGGDACQDLVESIVHYLTVFCLSYRCVFVQDNTVIGVCSNMTNTTRNVSHKSHLAWSRARNNSCTTCLLRVHMVLRQQGMQSLRQSTSCLLRLATM